MKNKFIGKAVSVLALSAALCLAVAGAVYAETADADDYVYSGQAQETEAPQTGGYVYRQGKDAVEGEAETAEGQDEESLQDLALQLLEDNKINIAVLMILLILLGLILYKNDKLTAARKR